MIPNDPFFASQWHLRKTTPGLYDLNVTSVWDDYTGAGIRVGIIDDGFDLTHVDFPAFDTAAGFDFKEDDADPSGTSSDNHGTAVAGIIGARQNGVGVVGVAYESTLSGYRLDFSVSDDFFSGIAASIGRAVDFGVDVINMSLGAISFLDANAIEAGLQVAFDDAVLNGREGLGMIM